MLPRSPSTSTPETGKVLQETAPPGRSCPQRLSDNERKCTAEAQQKWSTTANSSLVCPTCTRSFRARVPDSLAIFELNALNHLAPEVCGGHHCTQWTNNKPTNFLCHFSFPVMSRIITTQHAWCWIHAWYFIGDGHVMIHCNHPTPNQCWYHACSSVLVELWIKFNC